MFPNNNRLSCLSSLESSVLATSLSRMLCNANNTHTIRDRVAFSTHAYLLALPPSCPVVIKKCMQDRLRLLFGDKITLKGSKVFLECSDRQSVIVRASEGATVVLKAVHFLCGTTADDACL